MGEINSQSSIGTADFNPQHKQSYGILYQPQKTCGNCWIYTKIHNAELNSWEAHWHTGMQPTFIVAISPSIPDTSYSIPCSFHFNWLCSIIIKIPQHGWFDHCGSLKCPMLNVLVLDCRVFGYYSCWRIFIMSDQICWSNRHIYLLINLRSNG